MRKLFLLLILFITVQAFGQTPTTPVQVNQNTWYSDSATGFYWVFSNSPFGWRQMIDSTQFKRISTLQKVTDNGNTTTNSISVGGIRNPTHSLTIPSTGSGISLYQNSDTVNYKRAVFGNYGSDTTFLMTQFGGNITSLQTFRFAVGTYAGQDVPNIAARNFSINKLTPNFLFNTQTFLDGDVVQINPQLKSSTGEQNALNVEPKIKQGSVATANAIKINIRYDSIYHPPVNLISAQVEGDEKFVVNADGGIKAPYLTDGTAISGLGLDADGNFITITPSLDSTTIANTYLKKDSATLQYVTNNNRYSNVSTVLGDKTLQNSPANKTDYLLSDSYGLPVKPFAPYLGAVQRMSNNLRHTLTNYSISGTRKTTGDSAAVNRLYRIPTYNSSTMGYYVVWYPVNDCFASIDTADYRAANITIANNLVLKGWPSNKVVWGGQSYYNADATSLNIPQYNYIDSTVAHSYGFIYVNTYEEGDNLLLSDGLHGNTTYNEIMGARFIKGVSATPIGADLTVKGQVLADGLNVYLPQTSNDRQGLLIIADSATTVTSTNPMIELDYFHNTNTFQPVIKFGRNSGSWNSKIFTPSSSVTPNGMSLGGIQWGGNDGILGDLIVAELKANVNGTPVSGKVPTDVSMSVMGLDVTNRQITQTWLNNGGISFAGSVKNGVSTLTRGITMAQTMNAGVNNSRLYDIDFTGTKVAGAFTGMTSANIRLNDKIIPASTKTIDLGLTTNTFNNIYANGLLSTTNDLTLSAGGVNTMILQTNGSTRMSISSIGVVNVGQLTASQAVFTDASKNLVSNTITGTGNVVMSASPNLTGVPTAPTAVAGTNTTQIATTAFVQSAIGAAGSVTNVSGVNTNGFTWSIANPTTTPALTLTLQDAGAAQAGQMTAGTQTIGGVKTWTNNQIHQGRILVNEPVGSLDVTSKIVVGGNINVTDGYYDVQSTADADTRTAVFNDGTNGGLNFYNTTGTQYRLLFDMVNNEFKAGSFAAEKGLAFRDDIATASDADYIITSANQFVKLPLITANRTVSIPAAASYVGRQIKILNQNTSGTFNWSFTGATVKDAAENTLTTLVNSTAYIIESDGTQWYKLN